MLLYILSIVLIVGAFLFVSAKKLQFKDAPSSIVYRSKSEFPYIVVTMYKAILTSFVKKEGSLPKLANPLPEVKAKYSTTISQQEISRYFKLCSFSDAKQEVRQWKDTEVWKVGSICYSEVLCLPLMASVIIDPAFPLCAVGLIHIRNSIIQYEEINTEEKLELSCSVGGHKETEQGLEVHLFAEARSPSGKVVWSCISTMLSRNKQTRENQGNRKRLNSENSTPEKWEKQKLVSIPAGVGVAYAKFSGDWNPHHVWPITAKLVGYPRPMVHGMWSLACCMRETYIELSGKFPSYPIRVDASWKRPIYFPNEVQFSTRVENDSSIAFALHDKEGHVPHLIGSIAPYK